MTSYKNFFIDFGFRIEKYPPTPNLSKMKPIFWQIYKFLHFSVPRHIHNKRLPWQHLRLMRIVIMRKMTPISVRLNLKNFILISCAVLELLRKVCQGGEIRPPPRWDRVKMNSLGYARFKAGSVKAILPVRVKTCIQVDNVPKIFFIRFGKEGSETVKLTTLLNLIAWFWFIRRAVATRKSVSKLWSPRL